MRNVHARGWRNPFSGVNTALEKEDWFVGLGGSSELAKQNYTTLTLSI